ncbi:hypothetical protein LAZ67_23000275 [Cordylochernes scorpioides]|uniref:Reverse transcriptase domain-containing protein n=1 Tax=Cordylochernes scorpioides TaxID=51811 RepID=A0ABY6LPV9_9ARAC|nr:hypothetical protein LAZ67_23000275 [Cordylochernes scorpioides]
MKTLRLGFLWTIYADDTAILAQAKTFEELEIQLNKDLETLHNYFENWSLRLNPAKSVHCCFNLNHHRAERKLNLFINNSQITHSEHPKYLGIHLDRTLTFKTHLTKLKGKLSSRNNILHKLAGSSWGSDANTLRTSALALIFSTAEYCAPVWEGSCHTKLIDTQLNSTLRIITGVCQPTRIDWLPVLAHISPPELRRKEATKKMYLKLLDSPDLEINPILQSPPNHRLKSRNPINNTSRNASGVAPRLYFAQTPEVSYSGPGEEKNRGISKVEKSDSQEVKSTEVSKAGINQGVDLSRAGRETTRV